MTDLAASELELLCAMPEFRRFLFAAIQSAGILSQEGPAHGQAARDLSYAEGRRSLGFDILHMAHRGQPEEVRSADPGALVTLNAAIVAAMTPPKEKTRGRRNDDTSRYNDIDG